VGYLDEQIAESGVDRHSDSGGGSSPGSAVMRYHRSGYRPSHLISHPRGCGL
jgi:hypothetical protein